MKQFDIVIAGGAMAGMTLAFALNHHSKGKLDIAVVEAYQTDHKAHPGFDSRAIALSYGTVELLKTMKLWSDIKSVATPIEHIHVSDRGHAGMTDITTSEVGVSALGYVVELADIGRIYAQKVESVDGITLFCPAQVEKIEREIEKASITLNTGEQLETKLLVAADGAISQCCEQVGLPLTEHDFEQVAVIANITTEHAHQGRAFERFTDSGPVALLPMSDDRLSLVWCLRPEQAKHVMTLDDANFASELQKAFGWRLGKIVKAGKRAHYPLLLRYREQNISHRFAIVGNAAQTLHPIAGQGFNLGIRDVVSLSEQVAFGIEDPGAYPILAQYASRRADDREATMTLTSCLVHLFSNDFLTLRVGRNLGLAAMDNLPLLKSPVLKRTLGLVAR